MLSNRFIRWLSCLTTIGMAFVLLGGALVTKMDAGMGCGDDWPLCHGKFVPAYTLESMVEYSHRAVSGIVGLFVLLTFICIWIAVKERKDVRLYAGSALFFTVLQAFLGFLAVKWEQSNAVMALHFGFSLLAFASTLLLTIAVWRLDVPTHPSGWGADNQDRAVTKGMRNFVWMTTIYSYVVVYLGAFVRHTDSVSGCRGWPLCNGQLIPDGSTATTIAFLHRVAALLLLIMMIWMGIKALRQFADIKGVRLGAIYSMVFIGAQVLSGALVVFTLSNENAYVFTGLLHNTIVSGMFGILCYLSFITWRLAEKEG